MKIVLLNAAAPDYVWNKRYTPEDFLKAVPVRSADVNRTHMIPSWPVPSCCPLKRKLEFASAGIADVIIRKLKTGFRYIEAVTVRTEWPDRRFRIFFGAGEEGTVAISAAADGLPFCLFLIVTVFHFCGPFPFRCVPVSSLHPQYNMDFSTQQAHRFHRGPFRRFVLTGHNISPSLYGNKQ